MTNRRDFIAAGAAVLAGHGFAGAAFAADGQAAGASATLTPSYMVVFDDRFADGRAFASAARRLGGVAAAIREDVTDLWKNDLRERWSAAPAPLVGLTTIASLFCLEQLAANHWMRVSFRAQHVYLEDGLIRHELTGPEGLIQRAEGLAMTPAHWTRQFAGVLANSAANDGRSISATIVTPTDREVLGQEPLVSWIMTPRQS